MSADGFTYQGTELDLFQHATNWKRYYAAKLARFIQGDVLEVGAGIGATSRILCRGSERSWTCLEPDGELTARLTESLSKQPLPTKTRVVRGTLAAVRPEQFDTLLYIDVLEHIQRDRDELAAAAATVAEGGHLIVLSPAHEWLFSPFDKAIGHWRRYSTGTLARLSPPELTLDRAFYLDSVGMLASLANRAVLRASTPTLSQIRFWDSTIIPLSRALDPLLGFRLGKTVIAIWSRPSHGRS